MAESRPTEISAAIDVGSNSVHLLVAQVGGDGAIRPIRDESVLLGLGAHVDLEGHIGEADGAAAIDVLTDYVAAATVAGADAILLLGTEPLRRAADRSSFCRAVEATLGIPLQVLTQDEEAMLTVLGVLAGRTVTEPTLVLDIGGGSSQLVLIEPGADPVIGVLPVGTARLSAAHIEDDPPTPREVEAMRTEARRLMAAMPAGRPTQGFVAGGSGTNLLQLVDPSGMGGSDPVGVVDRGRVRLALDLLMSRPAARLAGEVGLRERRILQMAAGASLIEAALDAYALDALEASGSSLREGVLQAWARQGERWRERLPQLDTGS